MDKVGGKGHDEGGEEVDVVLAGSEAIEVRGGVVDEEVGNGDLRVKDDADATHVDVGGKGAHNAR